MPFWEWEFFTPGVRLAIVDPLAKFKKHSFVHSRNIEGSLKFQKRARDLDHAPLGWNFFYPWGGTSRT